MEPEADGLKCMDMACNPQRISGRCRKAQMIPYWASSCSSRWLKASQGQMTVMSAKKKTGISGCSWPPQIIETDMKCFFKNLKQTHLCLSPPFQGYRHQNCKEKTNYTPWPAIISEPLYKKICIAWGIPLDSLLRRLALELTGLPLLELGWSLAWGGGASADTGGRLDLSFGRLKIHFDQLWYLCAGCGL